MTDSTPRADHCAHDHHARYERTLGALRELGLLEGEARKALAELKRMTRATKVKDLLVEALAVLVPSSANLTVRESPWPNPPYIPSSCANRLSWDGDGHTFERLNPSD